MAIDPNAFPILRSMRFDVPCASCGETDSQTVFDLVTNDHVACRMCGADIDVSSQEWRALIDEAAESLSRITVLRP
jgi:ribosomal protein S27E